VKPIASPAWNCARGRDGRTDDGALEADLVVDASGRTSRAPAWLTGLGYAAPKETTVNSFLGYASRLYQPPAGFKADWKILLIRQRTPASARGGGIYAIEGGKWLVNLGASGRDYPPIDNGGFLEFARALPDPAIHTALTQAQPLSAINGYRRTENRWRHYEKLDHLPDNFVVLGDAACAFNPVYGQGMTVAALGVQALDDVLARSGTGTASLPRGFALRFQRRLARILRDPWLMATSEDFRTPSTEGGKPSRLARFTHRYFDRVLALAVADPDTNRLFSEVLNLLKPPLALFHPGVVWKVVRFGRRTPRQAHGNVKPGDARQSSAVSRLSSVERVERSAS
jgi:hypothetical protein